MCLFDLVCPNFMEMTVRGAAIAAGLSMGVWPNTSQLPSLDGKVYTAMITQDGKGLLDEKPMHFAY